MADLITDTSSGHVRVREFLRKWHGREPFPRRSYLVSSEVNDLMLDAGYVCLCATHDLEIRGHDGKWRVAVEEQIRKDNGLNWLNAEFWLNARNAFIELGGPLKGQGNG